MNEYFEFFLNSKFDPNELVGSGDGILDLNELVALGDATFGD